MLTIMGVLVVYLVQQDKLVQALDGLIVMAVIMGIIQE